MLERRRTVAGRANVVSMPARDNPEASDREFPVEEKLPSAPPSSESANTVAATREFPVEEKLPSAPNSGIRAEDLEAAPRRPETRETSGPSADTLAAAREFPVEEKLPSAPTSGVRADDIEAAPRRPAYNESSEMARAEARDERSFSIFGVDTGAPREESHERVAGLHGPSVLGLGDEESSGDYLLEDDERGGGRKFLLAVVVIVLAVLAVMQWRSDTPVRAIATRSWDAIRARATGEKAAKPAPSAADQANATTEQNAAANATDAARPASAAPDQQAQKTGGADANAGTEPKPADNHPLTMADAQHPQGDHAATDEKPAEAEAADAAAPKNAEPASPERGSATNTPPAKQPAKPPAVRDRSEAARETGSRSRGRGVANDAEAAPDRGAPQSAADDAIVTRAQGYLYGRGGQKSCQMALSLLKQAAGHGNPKASSQLGAMYATGNCAPYNRAEAYRWFSKAADAQPRNAYLKQNREMLWREMTPQERAKVLE